MNWNRSSSLLSVFGIFLLLVCCTTIGPASAVEHIFLDNDVYGVEDTIIVTLVDPSMNKNDSAVDVTYDNGDSVLDAGEVKVESESGGGFIIQLVEVGNNAGVFTGKFQVTSGGTSKPYLHVVGGDDVTVTYMGGSGEVSVSTSIQPGSEEGDLFPIPLHYIIAVLVVVAVILVYVGYRKHWYMLHMESEDAI